MGEYKKTTYIFIFSFLIFFDQISKYIVRHLPVGGGGFYICNPGISFGIRVPEIIFYSLWILVILFLLFSLYKKYFLHSTFYILLILSGAVSNIIDRFYFGCVIDFIDLHFWPIFNLADVYITIGVILFFKKYFLKK
jgi:signal peptidase II